jgi:hypothetical protein
MDFSTYQREAKRKPVEIKLPDGDVLVVPIPDGDKMMQIEEAGLTRKTLKIALGGEGYARLGPLVEGLKDPDALREFCMDLMRELGVSADDRPPADGPR